MVAVEALSRKRPLGGAEDAEAGNRSAGDLGIFEEDESEGQEEGPTPQRPRRESGCNVEPWDMQNKICCPNEAWLS